MKDVWSVWTYDKIHKWTSIVYLLIFLLSASIVDLGFRVKNSSIVCISFQKTSWCKSFLYVTNHTAEQIQRNWIGPSNSVLKNYLINDIIKIQINNDNKTWSSRKWHNDIAHHTHEVTLFKYSMAYHIKIFVCFCSRTQNCPPSQTKNINRKPKKKKKRHKIHINIFHSVDQCLRGCPALFSK